VKPVVYDAGVLVAADRGERRVWAEHRVRLEAGQVPLVPAPVVAQVSRAPHQAQLRQLLRGCEVVSFAEVDAHQAGTLLGKTRTTDVADGSVAALAIRRQADIVTADRSDILRLLSAARSKLGVIDV
jgi:predicted nucleic acid-binding protein